MKIYEKPMAIVNKFEVEDVIAASEFAGSVTDAELGEIQAVAGNENVTQGVVFQW